MGCCWSWCCCYRCCCCCWPFKNFSLSATKFFPFNHDGKLLALMSSFNNKYNASKKSFVHTHTHTHTRTNTHTHLKNYNPNKNVWLAYFSVVKNSSVKNRNKSVSGISTKKGEKVNWGVRLLSQCYNVFRNLWQRFLLPQYSRSFNFQSYLSVLHFFPLAGRQYCKRRRFVYYAIACIEKQFTPGKQFPHTVHVYAKTEYPPEDIQ